MYHKLIEHTILPRWHCCSPPCQHLHHHPPLTTLFLEVLVQVLPVDFIECDCKVQVQEGRGRFQALRVHTDSHLIGIKKKAESPTIYISLPQASTCLTPSANLWDVTAGPGCYNYQIWVKGWGFPPVSAGYPPSTGGWSDSWVHSRSETILGIQERVRPTGMGPHTDSHLIGFKKKEESPIIYISLPQASTCLTPSADLWDVTAGPGCYNYQIWVKGWGFPPVSAGYPPSTGGWSDSWVHSRSETILGIQERVRATGMGPLVKWCWKSFGCAPSNWPVTYSNWYLDPSHACTIGAPSSI